MSWLGSGALRHIVIWPLDGLDGVERCVVHEGAAFVVYQRDRAFPSGSIYDRTRVFPFGKKVWWQRRMDDWAALELAIAYANEANGKGRYQEMAAEIGEIQDIIGEL